MGAIVFSTKNKSIGLSTSQRPVARRLIQDLFLASMRFSEFNYEYLLDPARKGGWVHTAMCGVSEYRSLELWINRLFGESNLVVGDSRFNVSEVALNTAMVMSDPIRLLARIESQCEIHCYVLRKNFEWMKSIVSSGILTGVYGEDCGWDSVISLLESSEDSIVLSYTVCDRFPTASIAGIDCSSDDLVDAWYEMSSDDMWDLAFKKLLLDKSLELCPENNLDYHYGAENINGFQLASILKKSYPHG